MDRQDYTMDFLDAFGSCLSTYLLVYFPACAGKGLGSNVNGFTNDIYRVLAVTMP